MKLSAIEPLRSKAINFQPPSIINRQLSVPRVRDHSNMGLNLQQANLSSAETITAPPKVFEFEPVSIDNCQHEDTRAFSQPVKFRILIIENDDLSRDRLSKMLEAKDTYVIEAKESGVGIDLAKRLLPDLVICELMMPEIDGYGIKFLLQHSKITEKIPFLFITTHTEQNDCNSETILLANNNKIESITREKLCNAITLRVPQRHRR